MLFIFTNHPCRQEVDPDSSRIIGIVRMIEDDDVVTEHLRSGGSEHASLIVGVVVLLDADLHEEVALVVIASLEVVTVPITTLPR